MKKSIGMLLAAVAAAGMCASCGAPAGDEGPGMEPEVSQMKAICELAVMDCYYHNVAKFKEEDAAGILWWTKDKHFWIEYSGIVQLGVDVSQVEIEIEDTRVTIQLPEAKVLGCKVDSASLTEDSFIVAQDSADIEAEDEVEAFEAAQSDLHETAANDKALLESARQRAQDLLDGYISNIGQAVGKTYTIEWVYLDGGESPDGAGAEEPADSQAADEAPDAPETPEAAP